MVGMRSFSVALVAAAGFALCVGATETAAAATSIYWPAGQMAAALVAKQYPQKPASAARCTGIGHPRGSRYAAFKCGVTINEGALLFINDTVYARPLKRGGVCASTKSLKTCHKLHSSRLAWDPTICGLEAEYACAQTAAFRAIEGHYGPHIADVACQVTKANSLNFWRCTWQSSTTPRAAAVRFSKGKSAWTVTVSPE
jgi:hypothetical protein